MEIQRAIRGLNNGSQYQKLGSLNVGTTHQKAKVVEMAQRSVVILVGRC